MNRGNCQVRASHLAQIARPVVILLLAFLVVAGEAQSKQTVPIVKPFEGSLPGTELSVVKFYKPVDVNVDFNKEFSQPRSAPSGLLLPADLSRDEYAYSTGATTVADMPKNDLPSAPIRIDLTPLLVHLAQAAENPHAAPSADGEEEHYHWKGLLLQSLGFIAVENVFRLMTDETYRDLTADKPYWHDYIASLKQWNMRRWSDGDDFLVDDIGHPMQGAVSSFIEIQNDPHARNLRISASSAYWKSRFVGMMWATVFSTQQKIGPLGEAALGSDGGETYVPGCAYPCPSYKPGVTKYTNNTGWTDFIATPVIGTGWVLLDDSIDRYISDPVQDRYPNAVFPKILRGGLNPCRTMANALRLKKPWYRDFQHTDEVVPAVHFVREDAEVLKSLPSFEIFPHFNALSLPVNTSQCSSCRRLTTGSGVGFSYRISRWVDFDSNLSYVPNASPFPSDRAGGNLISGTFGFRAGIQTPRYALKVALRPGFVSYDRAYLTSPTGIHLGSLTGPVIIPPVSATPEIGRITHFVTSLSINADYALTRHFALRAAFGNTPVRYKTDYYDRPPGRGSPPYISFISPDVYATNENWNYQVGPVLRF
ncbi:MAG TPA: hypothetical protein VK729_07030 [Silvibacterium sp.]|nr:hypothetical protein [Silvibacterium sp.]